MRSRAHRGRPDANQPAIVRELIARGFSVLDLSKMGGGCPDILIGVPSIAGAAPRNVLVELKTKDGVLLESQKEFRAKWKGPVYVARTLVQALAALGVTRAT